MSVCHAAPSNRFFLFLDGIESFFGGHLSMWHSTKLFSSIFDLPPPHAQNLLHKIYIFTKPPTTLLVWQIDRRCLHLPGGFQGWPIQWNHAKCCGPTLVAMATKFRQIWAIFSQNRLSRLVCQIDWICLGLQGRRLTTMGLPWQQHLR